MYKVSRAYVSPSGPSFRLGFASLHEMHPDLIGEPLEDELPPTKDAAVPGVSVQRTTKGTLIWVGRGNSEILMFVEHDGFRHIWTSVDPVQGSPTQSVGIIPR